jgi:hypothetical protein
MAISESRKAALQKEQDMMLALGPEAYEAMRGRKDYLGKRRSAIVQQPSLIRAIPKLPPVTAAERAGAARTQEILEIQKMKQKVLDNIAKYRETDNPLERMKLAHEVVHAQKQTMASVIVGRLGAQGKVLAQEIRNAGEREKQIGILNVTYGMDFAESGTWTAKDYFITAIKDVEATQSITKGGEWALVESASKAMKMVEDPAEKKRLIAAIDGEMTQRGLRPMSAIIQEGAAEYAEDPQVHTDNRFISDLVTQTEGWREGELGVAARTNRLEIEQLSDNKNIEKAKRQLGGSIGKIGDVITSYDQINKALGTPGDEADTAAMKPFTDQIEELDAMIKTLKRPSFTDEYQRSRVQMLAHPAFKTYMDMRGFMPGQEDAAIKQLVEEAGPMIQKQAAVGRMASKIDPDDPRTAIGKVTSKIPFLGGIGMSKKRKEAVRRAAELDPATEEEAESRAETLKEIGAEGPSQWTRQREAREEMGLDPDKTLFQMEGLTPSPARVGEQMKEIAGPVSEVTGDEGDAPPLASAAPVSQAAAPDMAGEVPAVDFVSKRDDPRRQKRVEALRGFAPTFGQPSVVT